MKKFFVTLLGALVALMVLAGCSAGNRPLGTTGADATPTAAATPTEAATATAGQTGDAVKTGLGVVISIASSKDAGEADGLAQVDAIVAAVTVGGDGKIAACMIDAAQTGINFSAAGKITTPLDTAYKTKQELGDEYGMKKNSGVQKEWYEQADAFAAYAVGKTIDEVKGIAVNEEGVPTEADLTSSVTVHIADFTSAIEKAVVNAQDLGAKAGDTLGLGIQTSIGDSKDAGDGDGLAQAYSYYTAATYGADGKITSAVIDASQGSVTFSAQGKLTSDLAASQLTKNELADQYGMKKNSGIGKEWYEQAAAFAQYVKGKTIDEVKGVAVNEEGVPTEADLTSSVTVHIGEFVAVLEKSADRAKK